MFYAVEQSCVPEGVGMALLNLTYQQCCSLCSNTPLQGQIEPEERVGLYTMIPAFRSTVPVIKGDVCPMLAELPG